MNCKKCGLDSTTEICQSCNKIINCTVCRKEALNRGRLTCETCYETIVAYKKGSGGDALFVADPVRIKVTYRVVEIGMTSIMDVPSVSSSFRLPKHFTMDSDGNIDRKFWSVFVKIPVWEGLLIGEGGEEIMTQDTKQTVYVIQSVKIDVE